MAEHSHPHPHAHAEPPDTLGAVLSAVCAVHCVSTPLVLAMAPSMASVFGGAHPVLLALVIGVAVWAFVPGYRCHHSSLVLGLALGGVTLLSVAAFGFSDSWLLETLLSLAGAGMMMAAHWKNRSLLRQAHHAAHAH